MAIVLRPRFELELARPSREVIEQLSAHLRSTSLVLRRARVPGGGAERGPRDQDHLTLTIPKPEQHLWSPWLEIEVSPNQDGTRIGARFSPHPSVWTGFAFGYLTLGVVGLVALTIVASGEMLDGSEQRWAWWLVGGAAVAMIAMWGVSMLGQRLARDQMQTLRTNLDRAVEACRATR